MELREKASHLAAGVLAPPWERLYDVEHEAMDNEILFEQLILNVTKALKLLPSDLDDDLRRKAKQQINKVQTSRIKDPVIYFVNRLA